MVVAEDVVDYFTRPKMFEPQCPREQFDLVSECRYCGSMIGELVQSAFSLGVWGAHSVRLAQYAYFTTLYLGASMEWRSRYVMAALLHDIGKTATKELEELFLLERKFTPEERRRAEEHGPAGIAMVRAEQIQTLLKFDDTCLITTWEGQVTHHVDFCKTISREKFELLYPDREYEGLTGKRLPLAGRLIAVLDVFDALTMDRPYKRTWTQADAAAYLKHYRGRWYDPEIVDVFVDQVLPEVFGVKFVDLNWRTRFLPFIWSAKDVGFGARCLFRKLV